MEHIGQCRVCGTSWTGPEDLPCPTPERHKVDVGPQPNYEAMQRHISFLENRLEDIRAQHHHEVLCSALDRQFENSGGSLSDDKIAEIVRRSRLAADLAYPPPKDENQ